MAMAAVLMLIARSFGDRLWIRDRELAVPTARFPNCALDAIARTDGVRALRNQDLAGGVAFEATPEALPDTVGQVYRLRPGAVRIRLGARAAFTPAQERVADALLAALSEAMRRECAR
ncbi:MAG: hypothetical protein ACJ8IK_07985 [Burkholderiaceae bacterium]